MILKGTFLHTPKLGTLEVRPEAYLISQGETIVGLYDTLPPEYAGQPVEDWGDALIIPAFTDLHIHAPQIINRGIGYDKELLPWLETYTFPAEARFADPAFSDRAWKAFLNHLWAVGTLRFSAFATVHKEAAWRLMELSEASGLRGLIGKVNTTLLRTAKGVGILLQLDLTTPRPYSRLQTACGTDGFVQKYPCPTVELLGMDKALTDTAALDFMAQARIDGVSDLIDEGRRRGTENVMNFTMDARLIYCLRHGLPLDLDVYDAAEWSCIAELSELSAREGSCPVAIPDFTRGRWDVVRGHRFATA